MLKIFLKQVVLWVLLLGGMSVGHAQTTTAALQTPEQFLGYRLGEQFTYHGRLVDYVRYLAGQNPNKMQLQTYGHTYEKRPLLLATISSPANMQRLEEIRTNNLKSTGLMSGQPTGGKQPAIVWLSYNIHGNESVSSEAVLQVLYDLLDPNNAQTQKWLENTVVMIDPCVNPDGRERYTQWYNRARNQVPNASPYAWEHNEPWPGGRPNHYYFDLNRDWAWQTQIESKQRAVVYNQWMPQLHADFHEQAVDNPYYFAPSAKPYHDAITPWQREFQGIIGDYNRKYFDKNNWLYFTRESFDLFYPSYGDTWPTYQGAIAMTYEQGGSGRAGVVIQKSDGDSLTLSQRIAHHHAASLATVEAISDKTDQVVKEFRKFYTDAQAKPFGQYRSYVFKVKGEEGRIKELTEYLDRQQIRYGYAKAGGSSKGFNYQSGKTESVKYESGDLVISAYQPKSTLLNVLLEPSARLEDSVTYDITAWSLPYAYGLRGAAFTGRISMNEAKPAATVTNAAAPAAYAYIARWNGVQDLKFLASLLKSKVRVRYSEVPFEQNKEKYAPGTLIITRTGNESLGAKFDQIVTRAADSLGIQLASTTTGFVTSGSDFGSRSVRYVKAPRVALLTGEGVSPYGFGEIWHYFEQQIGYPVTVLGGDYFGNVPLNEFDVLILPTGSYGRILDEKNLTKVKDWVRAGGKLIALESAVTFLADKPDFAVKKKTADTTTSKKAPSADDLKKYANRERESISEEVQGSVFRINLDNTHPLAFGYGTTYPALIRTNTLPQFMKDAWNVGVVKGEAPATGFVGSKAKADLQNGMVLGVQDLGRGQVVYLVDNPLFRAFWQGGKLLFGNAVFLVGQ
ncbi:M14 family metallopeptidase [Rufibacter sediminis]|uniref:Zinc carboxypeptidase n=1 Tax=Rufibacter sediminis TaxID=2762756 RepID=A0ABR6VWH1_9BACT|nr:M14 family metallopeptidase [Rufibacter sediminis]MBC3541499.1 zinc carboxypeptidase [Rufibacter sediminis]